MGEVKLHSPLFGAVISTLFTTPAEVLPGLIVNVVPVATAPNAIGNPERRILPSRIVNTRIGDNLLFILCII